jgi:RNA polymerase sigma-70 factor (ECF subfamily)
MIPAFEKTAAREAPTAHHGNGVAAGHDINLAPQDEQTRETMIQLIPSLRAFAVSLTGSTVSADDLVQETLLRAIASFSSFEPGTNMGAWLFTILRNQVFSQYRRERRTSEYYRSLQDLQSGKIPPDQYSRLELDDLRKGLDTLPREQREAIILVGASGFSYDEAAAICGCAAGTIKSRVSRARARLAQLLDPDGPNIVGPDAQDLATVA